MAIAVVFPGQGSQTPGYGRAWLEHPAWHALDHAADALEAHADGRSVEHLLLDPEADLSATGDAQLAVLLGSLVAWEAVRDRLPGPAFVAGHSLGQITALIAAGVVEPADGLALAAARAAATQAAADERPGRLVALLGAEEATAAAACEAAPEAAWIANLNAPGQVVVGGTPEGCDAASARATELGVRRVRALAVGGAFHTPLMAPAVDRLRPTLDGLSTSAPDIPVVTNHDATPCTAADGWGDRLASHLVQPVRWQASVEAMAAAGVDHVVEVGPGTTLTALVKRIAPEVRTSNVATPDDLRALDDLVGSQAGVAR